MIYSLPGITNISIIISKEERSGRVLDMRSGVVGLSLTGGTVLCLKAWHFIL